MLFSVIVPVYKVEKYLNQCVQSILNQTYRDLEIILVDDGSPDQCPKMCDDYARNDCRIKVVHKKNGGIAAARQSGVEVATGEYIACVDSDDWITLDYIEKMYAEIEANHSDIVCCGCVKVYDEKYVDCPFGVKAGVYSKNRISSEILPSLIEGEDGTYFPASLWGKVIKRTLYAEMQVKDKFINVGEDYACMKPCVYYSRSLSILKENLYFYRQTNSSITKSRKPFDWSGPRIIGKHFEEKLPVLLFDFQNQIYRNIVHNLFIVAVSQFNRNESYFLIKSEIKKNISDAYYFNAISKCHFSFSAWKGNLAKIALKYKLISLIWLFNKINK